MSAAIIRPFPVDVTRLAADYSAACRDALAESQLLNVRNGDAVAADYVDTGELLAEALQLQIPGASPADYPDEIIAASNHAERSGFRVRRVLVACEFSGTVRDELLRAGHSAMSCDVLPTDSPGPHYQGDVRDIITDGWDTMLAFPPCTFLCSSGLHWNKRNPERAKKTAAALEFVLDLLTAPIGRIALENPVGAIGTQIRPADQYVQPYEFGDDASKKTGLWLDNLPLLQPTEYVQPRIVGGKPRWSNQTDSGQNREGPSADRWKIRSKTFPGLARAMAAQWCPA